jgi:SAM-dependent methyltransferase
VLFRPLAEALLAAGPSPAGRRVLDVACGTGVVARLAAAAGGDATGIDVHPGMLDVARTLEPRVTWLAGDAVALPLPDASFDLAYCQQGLQFVPDLAAALRELHRVLVPGGRLAVALWCDVSRAPGFRAYADALDRFGGPGDLMRRPFRLPDAAVVRDRLGDAGFTDVRVTTCIVPVRFPSVPAFFERQVEASPLSEPLAAVPATTRAAMVRELGDTLADRVDDDGLSFPAESHLFTAAVAGA